MQIGKIVVQTGLKVLFVLVTCASAVEKTTSKGEKTAVSEGGSGGVTKDSYYSQSLSFFSLFLYTGILGTIFVLFGVVRKLKKDVKKSHEQTVLEEMMESFGLKDFVRDDLTKYTDQFYFDEVKLKLKPKEDDDEV